MYSFPVQKRPHKGINATLTETTEIIFVGLFNIEDPIAFTDGQTPSLASLSIYAQHISHADAQVAIIRVSLCGKKVRFVRRRRLAGRIGWVLSDFSPTKPHFQQHSQPLNTSLGKPNVDFSSQKFPF